MKELEIKFICEKCGKEPERIEEDSNENWNVYPTQCECGGVIKPVLKD